MRDNENTKRWARVRTRACVCAPRRCICARGMCAFVSIRFSIELVCGMQGCVRARDVLGVGLCGCARVRACLYARRPVSLFHFFCTMPLAAPRFGRPFRLEKLAGDPIDGSTAPVIPTRSGRKPSARACLSRMPPAPNLRRRGL